MIDKLIPLFPNNINTFVDLFGGSGTVLLNTKAEHFIYNDINYYVTDILEGIYNTDFNEILKKIETIINQYLLPEQTGFLKLRDDYNNGFNDWYVLYTLSCYSFNWQIRFNNKHKYNSSWGKDRSSFTNRQKDGLRLCKDFFDENDVMFFKKSFIDFDFSDFDKFDFVYCDPPYLSSTGNYNDGKRGFEGWTDKHESSLLSILDDLSNKGVRFALSNNLKYENRLLDAWKNKYNIHYINHSYSNCNYQKLDRGNDIEVLITNY